MHYFALQTAFTLAIRDKMRTRSMQIDNVWRAGVQMCNSFYQLLQWSCCDDNCCIHEFNSRAKQA